MLGRLIRWAREGTIATVTVLAFASAPTAAEAGWFDDVKDAARGLGALMNPSHDLGKFMTGSVMVGGGMAVIASAEMATAIGAAAIIGTGITFGGIAIVAVGAGLAIWGGYKLWKSFNGNDGERTPPIRERPADGGGATDPGRPGRIDPGSTRPGEGNTPGVPGTVGGGTSSTPGDNGPRDRNDPRGPRFDNDGNNTPARPNTGTAAPAGMRPGTFLPR